MEPNEVKRLRRIAIKLGIRFNRVNNQKGSGYRIFTIPDFSPVASIDGIACNYEMTLDEVAKFIAQIYSERLEKTLSKVPAVNI